MYCAPTPSPPLFLWYLITSQTCFHQFLSAFSSFLHYSHTVLSYIPPFLPDLISSITPPVFSSHRPLIYSTLCHFPLLSFTPRLLPPLSHSPFYASSPITLPFSPSLIPLFFLCHLVPLPVFSRIHSSIHPLLSSAHPCSSHRGSRPCRVFQSLYSLATLSSSSCGILGRSSTQKGFILPPAGSGWGLLLVGCARTPKKQPFYSELPQEIL